MDARFEVSAHSDGGAMIAVAGEVDIGSAPALQSLIENALSKGRGVAISFEHCTYLDSSVIGVLMRTYKVALARALPFRLVAPSAGGPRRVFEIAGVAAVIPVVEAS